MDIHGKILVGCVAICVAVGIWTARINAAQERQIKALSALCREQKFRTDSLAIEVTGLRKCVANQATISALQTSLLK